MGLGMASSAYTDDQLTIEVTEDDANVSLVWKGRSIVRKPNDFVMPIMLDALSVANESGKRLVLDFQELEYMNSSTLTPIIKILERARRGETQLTVIYKESLRWQDLSFAALRIFETQDTRVEIKGI